MQPGPSTPQPTDKPSTTKPSLAKPLISTWRTPAVIVACGCLIATITYGPRSSFGFFMAPMTLDNAWGRDVFALSVAMQTLIYGMAQPFSGALADKFGTVRVIIIGALLYASGVFMMSRATTPGELYLTSGVLIGLGLTGCSFSLIIPSFGKLLPENWRTMSFGAGTAAGSFGQFLFSPLGVSLIDKVGWRATLEIFACIILLVIPLSFAIATSRQDASSPTKPGTWSANVVPGQTWKGALAEALGHRSFVLLVIGYFTCGFQLQFVTLHLPSYLIDRGLSVEVGGWTLGIIGLFNIIGALLSGYLASRMPKRYILAFIYSTRALAVVFLITMPAHPAVALIYGAVTGLLWLSSVPPTSGLVAVMFGPRWLSMLIGITFLSHQIGGALGVYLGGLLYEVTGSYNIIWWGGVVFGILSALINLPIVEKPVPRPAAVPAVA
ncbi:MAG TPA: MFS transporter [Xanthobacteraceae bacterium]|nr:MFS transporter [Xanthobacteraceae bacterium]